MPDIMLSPGPTETKFERMELVGIDAEAFLNALVNPLAPADRLVLALRQYKSLQPSPSPPRRRGSITGSTNLRGG